MKTAYSSLFCILALMLCCVMFVGTVMVTSPVVALCADESETPSTEQTGNEDLGDITGAFSLVAGKVYTIMRAIIIPFCICALAFGGFQFLVGGSQGAEKARKVVIGVALAVCFVVFAPVVVNTLGKEISDQGNQGLDQYNPLD